MARFIDNANNQKSLHIYKNKINQRILNKMAKSNITRGILEETYKKNGFEGIKYLLGESVNGKVRVTINEKQVKKVFDALNEKNNENIETIVKAIDN